MAETAASAVELHDRRVQEQIEDAIKRMEQWVAEQTQQLRMTQPRRRVARHAFRKVICRRKWLVLPRHTDTERRFLRMMLMLAIATDPGLQNRAIELARYMSNNYVYEWLTNRSTRTACNIARDVILREADSSFGSTPLAGQLAFVLFHHENLDIENVSNYTQLYSRALSLDKMGFFRDRFSEWRLDLGLQHHSKLRQDARKSQ